MTTRVKRVLRWPYTRTVFCFGVVGIGVLYQLIR